LLNRSSYFTTPTAVGQEKTMRSIRNAIILTLALGAAPAAWANDTFSDAHDDAPPAHAERRSWLLPYALAADAHDDSGVSARSLQAADGAVPVTAYALAPDAYDDGGMSARAFQPALGLIASREGVSAKTATAQSEPTTPTRVCICML
jgi:hypothetical protein